MTADPEDEGRTPDVGLVREGRGARELEGVLRAYHSVEGQTFRVVPLRSRGAALRQLQAGKVKAVAVGLLRGHV